MTYSLLLPQLIPGERGLTAMIMLLLGSYAIVDFLAGCEDSARRFRVVKAWLILLAVMVVTVIPTGLAIWMRGSTAPHRFVHDGLIQR